jgi:hypothetical protein
LVASTRLVAHLKLAFRLWNLRGPKGSEPFAYDFSVIARRRVGRGFCANSKINGIKEFERPSNYGQKKNWSALGVEQILERVSERFESNPERFKERSSRNNLARRCAMTLCWDHAGLSHAEIAALFGRPAAIRWLRRFGEPRPKTLKL